MRCGDLAGIWSDLRAWFADVDVLVLPRLEFTGPSVRLDADVDPTRPATQDEVAAVLARLRAVVTRFEVRAVYVGLAGGSMDGEPVGGEPVGGGGGDGPAAVTVRVLAGGVVHELTLVAAWYAALVDGSAARVEGVFAG
jgi:hypothetical protein